MLILLMFLNIGIVFVVEFVYDNGDIGPNYLLSLILGSCIEGPYHIIRSSKAIDLAK